MATLKARLEIKPRFRLALGSKPVFGPGKAELLGLIRETGSIAAAARRMRMSYMTAWQLVRSMNADCATPVVDAQRGGATKGGATLTKSGVDLLRLYTRVEAAGRRAAEKALPGLARIFCKPGGR